MLTYDSELEREIIGSLILRNDSIKDIIPTLEAKDFYSTIHVEVFSAIKLLYSKKESFEPIAICYVIGAEKTIEYDIKNYLLDLIMNTITTYNCNYFSKEIKKLSIMREILNSNESLKLEAENGLPVNEVLEIAKETNEKLYTEYQNINHKEITTEDIKNELLYELDHPETVKVNKTHIAPIDKLIIGFRNNELIIICGKTSHGKTALAGQIAYNFIIRGRRVLWFSLEMKAAAVYSRMVSLFSIITKQDFEIPAYTFYDPKIQPDQKRKVINNFNAAIKNNIVFSCFEGNTTQHIETSLEKHNNIELIVVDYLQLLSGEKAESRRLVVEQISRDLQRIASTRDIPILALSQLNKQGETRESMGISQDADKIIRIHREYQKTKKESEKNDCQIIVQKNRHGATGKVDVFFEPRFLYFRDDLHTNVLDSDSVSDDTPF